MLIIFLNLTNYFFNDVSSSNLMNKSERLEYKATLGNLDVGS